MILKEIFILFKKEVLLEWRERYALNGLILYIISTVFICYLSFQLRQNQLSPLTWNTLFWIILLFAAVNTIAKSFMQERSGRFLYYYTLVSPEAVILAKIFYNSALMLVVGVLGLGVYSLVMGNPVQDNTLFLLNIILGSIGFSTTLTMVSSIAAKAHNNSTLMAILSFPAIIPMLLMLIRISKNALDGLDWSASYDEMFTLLAINLIVLMVSYLLFPYLWRN
ncbi:MAG: heme exporter protein CcmB [Microscillaceae bacterium]|jgi:heme exporter protein B|nr:heme exporter protein CcmB [Microscillaceae bacterium]